jgi:hypothetical protein
VFQPANQQQSAMTETAIIAAAITLHSVNPSIADSILDLMGHTLQHFVTNAVKTW